MDTADLLIEEIKTKIKSMKSIRDRVINLLENYPKARNSDKYLQYKYWTIWDEVQTMDQWLEKATDPETLRRSRQLVQDPTSRHYRKDLCATKEVDEARNQEQFQWLDFVK